MKKITNEKLFKASMITIDTLLDKATKQGGFHTLSKEESSLLSDLSKQVEAYEDNTLHLMPIRPKSIKEAIEYKRVQLGLTQAKLAETLGMGAPKLSQILSGKRPPDVSFILALHNKLKIDSEFILNHLSRMNDTIPNSEGTGKVTSERLFRSQKTKKLNDRIKRARSKLLAKKMTKNRLHA